ncbi:hypothetical protein A3K24_00170 [candidate division Kazan bacterium RIFCSPHIGHO2_01_FULL_44_14]|uniref:Uncharacterized protein n=1 Tax=candidate division Kazan bacterium RIFCSPLOWO2_01_FULL_45_19 TaxID=1798538 RepID=A0A1F4NPA4_UNCK3|nr:MAG: hypothetical protein A3K51_00170 [candidate division Kazan bacterium RIFCSPLOWO2_01_FULL_45_19]OGB77528.1 MAG: hypothetical protein A3K24_00170 [candidate division Kazan bacterium RIFCSPHIGHO2_01_FULL_44_14]
MGRPWYELATRKIKVKFQIMCLDGLAHFQTRAICRALFIKRAPVRAPFLILKFYINVILGATLGGARGSRTEKGSPSVRRENKYSIS